MKRFFSLLTAAALAAALCGQALAAGTAELVRTFVYGDTLYTYVALSGADGPITKTEAKLGNQTFPASDKLETVRQAGSPVTCLLLVDNSNSMPPFRKEVAAFGAALAQASGENTRFLLATFGDDFTVISADVPAGQLAEQVSAIPFDETVTRLHTSMDHALDYLETFPREGNELRAMVVLSDAVQYDPAGGVPYETLLQRLQHSDVMLHSVGFGDDPAALEKLGALTDASGGTHQVIGETSAQDAASRLWDSLGDLFVTGFDISGCTSLGEEQPVSVTFAAGGELVCRGESTVDVPAGEGESAAAAPQPPDTALPPSGQGAGAAAPAESAAAAQSEEQLHVGILIASVVMAGVLAVIVWMQHSRRKKAPASPPNPSGIYMRLEVLQGERLGTKTEFTLERELLIGRDESCDVAFAGGAVSRRHARIFTAGGVVYVEDLSSQNGTRVNGLPIRTASALHSGDEITVGDAVFRFRF